MKDIDVWFCRVEEVTIVAYGPHGEEPLNRIVMRKRDSIPDLLKRVKKTHNIVQVGILPVDMLVDTNA